LIVSGATVEQIREQMGHASIAITQGVYRHQFALDRSELAALVGLSWDKLAAAEAATALVPADPDW
jgi:hypothetical protein